MKNLKEEKSSNLLNINFYFDKIYVLNLDHRVDRMNKMLSRLQKNNITNYIRFPAINGYKEPYYSQWNNIKRRSFGFLETPGSYGVLLSAYFIINHAIMNNYQNILILEDDIIFHKGFESLFSSKMSTIPQNWKLLYLGSSMHQWRIEQRCRRYENYLVPQGSIPGAFALGIKKECFSILIKNIMKLNSPWDMAPLKTINQTFPGECYVLYPNLIIADTRDSDIREPKSLEEKKRSCGWNLDNYDWEEKKI